MIRLTAAQPELLRLLGERGGALTAGEAASRTGLSLELMERQLLELAVAVGASLRVSDDGNVAYHFPRHLWRRLLARSWRLRLGATLNWLWRQSTRLVRLLIGTLLTLLALLLVTGLMVTGRIPASAEFLKAMAGLLLHVVLGVGDSVAGLARGRRRQDDDPVALQRQKAIQDDLELLESLFSVLFGDGDPNRNLEQRRWRRIGCFIAHRGGAVIAEDLAPLLDLPRRPADGERAGEIADAAMLPVLLRFDGRPEVSEQGEFAYHFPSLQVCSGLAKPAHGRGQALAADRPSPPLRERRCVFSRASSDVRWAYAVLSGALLLLAPMLFDILRPTPPLLAGLAWFSIGYALLLIAIPLLRLAALRWRNRPIEERNSLRTGWARSASSPTGRLDRKRSFARRFARHRHLGRDGLAYTTEKGMLEQEIES